MTSMRESGRTVEALQESERRLARSQTLAHVGDWEWELATDAMYWSDELYRIYGFEPHEIVPDNDFVLQRLHPESKESLRRALDLALKGEKSFELDCTIFKKDGSEAILHTVGQVVRDGAGTPVKVVGVVGDVTGQKRAEMMLRASEQRCKIIFDEAKDGILIADAEKRTFLEANRTICAMLGYSKEELLGLGVADIHPAEALPAVQEAFERQKRGEALAESIPVKRKDGTLFFADISAALVNMEKEACLVGTFRDITERKQAAEELRAERKRLAESQRIAHIGSWEHNLITNEGFWSDEMFRMLGLEPVKGGEDFDLFFSLVHPDDRPLLKKSIENTRQLHQPFSIEYRFRRKDGTIRIIHAQAELIPDNSGRPAILSGTAQDITERKLAEKKIQKSEEYIHDILDTVDEGFIVVGRDYRILTANRAYCEHVGKTFEGVVGEHCFQVSHQRSSPCYEDGAECSVKKVFAEGVPSTAHHRHQDAEGNTTYVETKAFPLRDEAGFVSQAIETINDITEKRLLEEERLKVQKLEAIGTLAGGIAHDFNNLLQGVFGYLSIAKLASAPNGEGAAALEQAEKALHLSVKLTNQLLTFSKGGKPLKKLIDIPTVIDNAVRFSLSGSSVKCSISGAANLWQVEADEGQITQVIQNIVLNAVQAMPGGGQVQVAMRNCQFEDLEWAEESRAGRYVEITIQDEGSGISKKDRKRIFDPYFTTKKKGSGLGLATSYSIIKNHGGWIRVTSLPQKGSTFFVYLPASEEVRGPEQEIIEANELDRSGRILVMDDEPMIRQVAKALITMLGHEPDFAVNGEEAVAKYRQALQENKPFDAVILDLTVRGGIGGEETVRQLASIDPGVKAVVSSGYADNAVVANYRDYGFAAFLNKPYDLEGLQKVLRAVLSDPGVQ